MSSNSSALLEVPLHIHQVSYGKAKSLASILCSSEVLAPFFSGINISWGVISDIHYQRQLLSYDVIFTPASQQALFKRSHSLVNTKSLPLFVVTTPSIELNKTTVWGKRVGLLGQTNAADTLISAAVANHFELTIDQIEPITFDDSEDMNKALERAMSTSSSLILNTMTTLNFTPHRLIF